MIRKALVRLIGIMFGLVGVAALIMPFRYEYDDTQTTLAVAAGGLFFAIFFLAIAYFLFTAKLSSKGHSGYHEADGYDYDGHSISDDFDFGDSD